MHPCKGRAHRISRLAHTQSTQDDELPILAPGPFPDPTAGKPAHELKHDFDKSYGDLQEGGVTSYEGLKPERDASKGYDWEVQWSEPYC
jgi:hypothetical protein